MISYSHPFSAQAQRAEHAQQAELDRTSIHYLKMTFFQTSIHAASGGTNSPHENPEDYKNEIPMDFIFIFFPDET